MFKKKGIKQVLTELQKHFPYLFTEQFHVAASKYDKKAFGNWIVVLQSSECNIRFYQDRAQVFLMIAPPWSPVTLETIELFFDLEFYIAFLEKRELVSEPADRPQGIELQYKKISKKFSLYYEKIIHLVNRDDFLEIERELSQIYSNMLSNELSQLLK